MNWKDSDGWTSLYHACLWNRADIVKELLKYNPELNQQNDDDGETALHTACRNIDRTLTCSPYLVIGTVYSNRDCLILKEPRKTLDLQQQSLAFS